MMMTRHIAHAWLHLCCVSCASVYGAIPATVDVITVALDLQQPLPAALTNAAARDDSHPSPQIDFTGEGLVAWAAREAHGHSLNGDFGSPDKRSFKDTVLLVGVKTNVVHNFPSRQAIRQTWAQRERLEPFGVRVVFLGCESDLSSYTVASERVELQRAIAMEKRVFGDLLTSELKCVDSYFTLVKKVVSYMNWVTETVSPQVPSLRYVAVADDDAYVRVDRVMARLHDETMPKSKLYAGFVWPIPPPVRDPSHKNYVPTSDYPMAVFPSFAGGPFYILSTDLARFVARNRHDLQQFGGGNDDLSVGIWLLTTMQVRAVHIEEMATVSWIPCQDYLLVIADIEPSAIRDLHENEVQHRNFCFGFRGRQAARQHRSVILPDAPEDFSFTDTNGAAGGLTWDLLHHTETNALSIRITIDIGPSGVDYDYTPALERYKDALCARGKRALQATLYVHVNYAFCQFHKRALSMYLEEAIAQDPRKRGLLTLARHNLKRKMADDVKVVALSRGARYARVLIECLFVEMYPNATILVLSEADPREAPPDVFVFSVLDGRDVSTNEYAKTFGSDTKLVMISGEAWPIDKLDSRVVLISTLEAAEHSKSLYIPVASTVFAESIQHSPLELLQPSSAGDRASENRRFCAYLYARCDRIRREFMFDLLNAIEPVDALGACQGTGRKPQAERRRARYDKPFYTDDAIALYQNYRFVIAFENTFDAVGYVTEKIVTAFLAGVVPIYYGHNASVKRLFNPRAFINCGDFESLPACAEFVSRVHESPEMYDAMRKERPVVNSTAFFESFSWHPDVVEWGYQQTSSIGKSVAMSIRLRQLINATTL